MRLAQLLCFLAGVVISCGGCALTNPLASTDTLQATQGEALQPNTAAQTFQKIKQAKRENAVILQVEGDAEPIRILPLPQEGQSVFVSDLLTQTGVFRQFGRIHAELFRDSTNLMDGVRMKVVIRDGETITPETDYALRPGDRLVVRSSTTTAIGDALDSLLPGNARRAFGMSH